LSTSAAPKLLRRLTISSEAIYLIAPAVRPRMKYLPPNR
jgi:hypothetical protein